MHKIKNYLQTIFKWITFKRIKFLFALIRLYFDKTLYNLMLIISYTSKNLMLESTEAKEIQINSA